MGNQKGIIRKIDPLGRLVIPKEIRKDLSISENDPVEIKVEGDTVVIKKHHDKCCFCGTTNASKLVIFRAKKVCTDCSDDIAKVKCN